MRAVNCDDVPQYPLKCGFVGTNRSTCACAILEAQNHKYVSFTCNLPVNRIANQFPKNSSVSVYHSSPLDRRGETEALISLRGPLREHNVANTLWVAVKCSIGLPFCDAIFRHFPHTHMPT